MIMLVVQDHQVNIADFDRPDIIRASYCGDGKYACEITAKTGSFF